MTNVFVVTVNVWDDVETVGVFSTREKAEAFVSTMEEVDRINSEVTEWTVDRDLRSGHPNLLTFTNPRDVQEAYEVGAITRDQMVEALRKCEN